MNTFLTALLGWLQSVVSAVSPHPSPKVTVNSSITTLKSIILSETRTFGPSPRTGGTIHTVNALTAETVANLIINKSKEFDLDPALIAAGICGESLFDPTAINPNHQDAKPGETAHEAFLHTDLGLCQFDAATLIGSPEFAGKNDAAIKTQAMDPNWSVPAFCKFVEKLIHDAKSEVGLEPSLLDNVPDHNFLIFALEAYNAGEHGAMHIAHAKGSFSYGQHWVDKYKAYAKILGKAKLVS